MELARFLFLFTAALFAGAVNSVAGGGSLLSFPAALAFGLPPVFASATNTVAHAPGGLAAAWAYRRELGTRRRLAFLLVLPASVGSLLGAAALLLAPARVFELVVPWLVLSATILLIVKDVLWERAKARAKESRARVVVVGFGLALIAIYGGYFGAGIGIVTLAILALLGDMTIHELNAMKSVIIAGVNGAAAVVFLARDKVDLGAAFVMACGTIVGGFGGASLARRVSPKKVRWLVVSIGLLLCTLLAVRYCRA